MVRSMAVSWRKASASVQTGEPQAVAALRPSEYADGVKHVLPRIVSLALVLVLVLVLVTPALIAQEVNLSQFQDEQPVILVFARNRDDDRPFIVNLDLSTVWSGVTARNIHVMDVDPVSYEVDRAAEQLELGNREFAVVLIARDGTTLTVTDENTAVSELFQILDDYEHDDYEQGERE